MILGNSANLDFGVRSLESETGRRLAKRFRFAPVGFKCILSTTVFDIFFVFLSAYIGIHDLAHRWKIEFAYLFRQTPEDDLSQNFKDQFPLKVKMKKLIRLLVFVFNLNKSQDLLFSAPIYIDKALVILSKVSRKNLCPKYTTHMIKIFLSNYLLAFIRNWHIFSGFHNKLHPIKPLPNLRREPEIKYLPKFSNLTLHGFNQLITSDPAPELSYPLTPTIVCILN
ncbi:hypothetical protein AVEN_32757-1 [Araneus ventricosus]|uniref:Uncharacterized protein n=1 Tax=Araneus ventricosus TaxID=182803 RepID=A0A4Y2CWV2_ARAVE|nr:hypothetical protein AVEN_32757-1 [Araneus ventricosus]